MTGADDTNYCRCELKVTAVRITSSSIIFVSMNAVECTIADINEWYVYVNV